MAFIYTIRFNEPSDLNSIVSSIDQENVCSLVKLGVEVLDGLSKVIKFAIARDIHGSCIWAEKTHELIKKMFLVAHDCESKYGNGVCIN